MSDGSSPGPKEASTSQPGCSVQVRLLPMPMPTAPGSSVDTTDCSGAWHGRPALGWGETMTGMQ